MNESSHYPMHCIGTDLFEYNSKPYLIVVDYFSLYPWIRPLRNISSLSVIEAMKSVFSEFGYPDKIHSDSGSQYSSKNLTHSPWSMTLNIVCHHRTIMRVTVNQNASMSRRIRVLKKTQHKTLDRLAIQLASMDSRFFLKTISAWNGLVFAEAPSLAVFRSNFYYKLACIPSA